jgi:hypothetical protein
MKHVLAAVGSLHDGGGIFSLVMSFVAIPFGLGMMVNYRGMAKQLGRPGYRPMKPLIARIFGGFFFAMGLVVLFEAIHRFAQGGY